MPSRYSNWERNEPRGYRWEDRDRDDWNRNQQYFGRDDRQFDEHLVGRDFMTNQPNFERYGEMSSGRGNRSQYYAPSSGTTYGPGRYSSEFSNRGYSSGRESPGIIGRHFGSGDFRNPDDFSDLSSGRTRDLYDRGDLYYQGRDRYFESNRTPFDESIAGRPYWGRDRESEDWRRTADQGYSDRNRGYSSSSRYGSSWDRDRFENREDRSVGDKVRDFFGIGPKGYKRSDDKIREEVSERLADHPYVDASEIEVQVKDAEVTLTGNVDDRRQKRLAEDVVEDCRGVKDVHNQLRVPSTLSTGSTLGKSATGTSGSSTRRDKDKESAA